MAIAIANKLTIRIIPGIRLEDQFPAHPMFVCDPLSLSLEILIPSEYPCTFSILYIDRNRINPNMVQIATTMDL